MVATREQLIDYGCTVLIDAYEGGSAGVASWAVGGGDYQFTEDENGNMTSASVTLYDMEDSEPSDEEDPLMGGSENALGYRSWTGQWYKVGKPHHITAEMIADFIVQVGQGKFDLSQIPDYGRLSGDTLKALVEMYHGLDTALDNWDCIDADAVVQTILLGEVVYG